MGKRIGRGFAKLGEVGQSGGAIITGANLRRPPEKKAPPAQKASPLRPPVKRSEGRPEDRPSATLVHKSRSKNKPH